MRRAVCLYGGEYLPADRMTYRRHTLADLRRGLVMGLDAAVGQDDDAQAALQDLVFDDPCEEAAVRALMRRYLVSGGPGGGNSALPAGCHGPSGGAGGHPRGRDGGSGAGGRVSPAIQHVVRRVGQRDARRLRRLPSNPGWIADHHRWLARTAAPRGAGNLCPHARQLELGGQQIVDSGAPA